MNNNVILLKFCEFSSIIYGFVAEPWMYAMTGVTLKRWHGNALALFCVFNVNIEYCSQNK